MFNDNISKEQVRALKDFFTAAKRKADATEYMNSRGRGARGAPEEVDASTAAYDASIHAAAEAFEENGS